MIFNRGPRREVPQRVANLAWTSSKNQKIRMLGKSILVTVAVVDHVRGGGGPSGASFDGFQSIQSAKTRISKSDLAHFWDKNGISKKLQAVFESVIPTRSLAPEAPTRLAGWF